jgi:GT2 family glycosyltransferase
MISVIIVTHNSRAFISQCLRSLQQQSTKCEIVVVDNGSSDKTPDLVRKDFPKVRIVEQTNLGFGAGCNRGVKESTGDVVAFLNPDTRPATDWLVHLVDELETGRIHTSQIIDDDRPDRVQTLGLDLHYTGIATLRRHGERAPLAGGAEEVPGLSGAAFALMRRDFERLGGFDEGFFLYMEDVDLAWRARRAGMTIWGIPASQVLHRRAGKLNPQKLGHIQVGRRRLLHKHVPPKILHRLRPALAVTEFLEMAAGGQAPEPTDEVLPVGTMTERPDWLRLTIPFHVAIGGARAFLGNAFLNPVLAFNGMLWRRRRQPDVRSRALA